MQVCLDMPVECSNRMGEAAHERVLARHCVDTEAAQLAKLFNPVAEKEYLPNGALLKSAYRTA